MKTVGEYAKHAHECRALAKNMPAGDAREQLLEMAKTWEVLAEERARHLRNQPAPDGQIAVTTAGPTSRKTNLT
jgi:hypothetical protein